MKLQAQLIQLQAWAQAELGAQKTLLEVLKGMEQAVIAGRAEALVQSGEALEAALEGNQKREETRAQLMQALGQSFGVPGATLSLSSVIERAKDKGLDIEPLVGLRDRLRARVQEVASCSHLLTVLASHHQGVLADLMAIIGAASTEEASSKNGVLLDARA